MAAPKSQRRIVADERTPTMPAFLGVAEKGCFAMPHVIAEPCIGAKDTSCVEVCPVDCIHPTQDNADGETAEQLYIDPDTCIDCGLCVDECPVRAIFPEEDLPEEWSQYVQINADYFASQ